MLCSHIMNPDQLHIIVREVDGESVVLNTRSKQVHQLSRKDSLIWRMRKGGAELETIASALAEDSHVDEEAALADVVETVSKLQALRLLDSP